MSEVFQRQPTHEEIVEGIAKGVHEALRETFVSLKVHGTPMRLAFKEAVADGLAAGFRTMFDGRLSDLVDAVKGGVAAGFIGAFSGRISDLMESVQAGVAKVLGSAKE